MSNFNRFSFASLVVAFALALAACGSDEPAVETEAAAAESPATTTTTTETTVPATTVSEPATPGLPPGDYAGFLAQGTACGAAAPDPLTVMTFDAPEDEGLDPSQAVPATIRTSCGDIAVELDPSVAPEAVNSFVFLARSGYFDGSVSHRVVPGFVLQAGDQTATGTGGPGYTIPDELPEPGFVYERGTLAMANAGPNSAGSQFFIVLTDAPLNPDFSVFGKVIDGFETLDLITTVPLGPNAFGEVSVPLETLYIEEVIVAE